MALTSDQLNGGGQSMFNNFGNRGMNTNGAAPPSTFEGNNTWSSSTVYQNPNVQEGPNSWSSSQVYSNPAYGQQQGQQQQYSAGTVLNPAYFKLTGQQLPMNGSYTSDGQYVIGAGQPQQQQTNPMQDMLMKLLTALLGGGQQQQQPQMQPHGNAVGDIQAMGGAVPNFLQMLNSGQGVSAPGDVSGTFNKMAGFGLPSPQSIGNMSNSEQQYFQGLTNSPLVGIPWADLLAAILQPYSGLKTARTAASK